MLNFGRYAQDLNANSWPQSDLPAAGFGARLRLVNIKGRYLKAKAEAPIDGSRVNLTGFAEQPACSEH